MINSIFLAGETAFLTGESHKSIDKMPDFSMRTGYVAPEDLRLCSWRGAVYYPDHFIGKANKERVSLPLLHPNLTLLWPVWRLGLC